MATRLGGGLGLAAVSAAAFGTSGTFAAALLDSGWTPGGAVVARIAIAALVLTGPALVQLRGRWGLLRRSAGSVAVYGLIAVAACQLFYFNAVQRLDVGVALLLEYLGGVLVVGWMWLRHGQRPGRLTVAGAVTALAGLTLVLGVVTGPVRLDLVGVLWGLAAAVGLAVFFVVAAHSDAELPPLVLAWSGLVVGAVVLGAAGLVGLVRMHASTATVELGGHRTSWLVPVLGLALVAGAFAYVAGIAATRRLRPRLASFVGLTEVVFAVLFAWLFLGQLPGVLQLVGGAVVVIGVAVVRLGEPAAEPDGAPAALPDAEPDAEPEVGAVVAG
jgi:drug/metabolite transporter (DMT)-like permease